MDWRKRTRQLLRRESHPLPKNHSHSTYWWNPPQISKTWKGIQWGRIAEIALAYYLGPHYQIAPRSSHLIFRMTPSPNSKRNCWSTKVRSQAFKEGDNLRILEPLYHKLLFCQKERWKASTHPRLPPHQQVDQEKLQCLPPHPSNYRLPKWMHAVHKIQHLMGV